MTSTVTLLLPAPLMIVVVVVVVSSVAPEPVVTERSPISTRAFNRKLGPAGSRKTTTLVPSSTALKSAKAAMDVVFTALTIASTSAAAEANPVPMLNAVPLKLSVHVSPATGVTPPRTNSSPRAFETEVAVLFDAGSICNSRFNSDPSVRDSVI